MGQVEEEHFRGERDGVGKRGWPSSQRGPREMYNIGTPIIIIVLFFL